MHEKIRTLIKETLLVGKDYNLDDVESLFDAGIMDSIGLMEFVGRLEQRFQIKVEDDEMLPENLDSVVSIAGYLSKKGIET